MLQCSLCGGMFEKLTKDHIIPRSLGGSNHRTNIRLACGPCNHTRMNRMTIQELLNVANADPLKIYRKKPTLKPKQFRNWIKLEMQSMGYKTRGATL